MVCIHVTDSKYFLFNFSNPMTYLESLFDSLPLVVITDRPGAMQERRVHEFPNLNSIVDILDYVVFLFVR